MLLAIDVGNTSIAYGVFDDEDLISTFSIETNKNSTQSEFSTILSKSLNEKKINPSKINSSIISCVVPEIMDIISDTIKDLFDTLPVVVSHTSKTNMPILYDDPEEVGADRIVNSVAAYNMFKSSAVVVDFGTATTFDCISAEGEYLGGSIAPGIKISSDALSVQASKLPKVDIVKPKNVIGKNTIESMQSGIVFGYVSLVDGLIGMIKKSMGTNPVVISTGGLSKLISEDSQMIEYTDEHLSLKGLKILFKLNG